MDVTKCPLCQLRGSCRGWLSSRWTCSHSFCLASCSFQPGLRASSISQNLKQEWKPQSQLLLRAHSKIPWKRPSTSLPNPGAMPTGEHAIPTQGT